MLTIIYSAEKQHVTVNAISHKKNFTSKIFTLNFAAINGRIYISSGMPITVMGTVKLKLTFT